MGKALFGVKTRAPTPRSPTHQQRRTVGEIEQMEMELLELPTANPEPLVDPRNEMGDLTHRLDSHPFRSPQNQTQRCSSLEEVR